MKMIPGAETGDRAFKASGVPASVSALSDRPVMGGNENDEWWETHNVGKEACVRDPEVACGASRGLPFSSIMG